MSTKPNSTPLRSVTLELLRHGPPHNQLLSPLTQYLGLCGNHSSVTVRVPYEHNEFRVRQESLLYQEGLETEEDTDSRKRRRTREVQLKLMAQEMGAILGAVPGLIADVNGGEEDEESLTCLELVLSASELALLPFELANSPIGFPGAGQFLSLQTERPVCVTRRVRRIDTEAVCWPKRQPKILFAVSDRGGNVPLPGHLAALVKALSPWVIADKDLEGWLKVLPRASAQQIAREVATGEYTCVHVLAHGVSTEEGFDERYALRLHNDQNPEEADDVSGERLIAAFRPHDDLGASSGLRQPTMITIASCNGGNMGSVVGAGASIAHMLHEAGIPLVVSSQFPLTFGASVLLAEEMYDGFLWGVNPYLRLSQLRRRLRMRMGASHDWASLIAYAALPQDLEHQLVEYRVAQASRAVEAAFNRYDNLVRKWGWYDKAKTAFEEDALAKAVRHLEDGKKRLGRVLENGPGPMSRPLGLLASIEKRHAEMEFRATLNEQAHGPSARVLDLLEQSRSSYRNAFEEDRSNTWALTQYISLCAVLDGRINLDEWMAATHMSRQDATRRRIVTAFRSKRTSWMQEMWGHGNLTELYLLSFLTKQPAPDKAVKHAKKLLKFAPRRSWEVFSTRRQIARYKYWYGEFCNFPPKMLTLVDRLLKILPSEDFRPVSQVARK